MTWFADLSPYGYIGSEPNTVNVGWLDSNELFTTGESDKEFAECLEEICRKGVNRTRGLHICNLCPESQSDQFPPDQNRVSSRAGNYLVGGAEIRVTGNDGIVYAAPDMLIHYVRAHAYKPPPDFIAAVMNLCRAA